MPRNNRKIFVQKDDSGPHRYAGDPVVEEAGKLEGWDIKVRNQPSQSPDLSILELCVFRSLQARQHQHPENSVEKIIDVVRQKYWGMDPMVLKSLITLQSVMRKILETGEGNNYKMGHMNKDKMIKDLDRSPERLKIDEETLNECLEVFGEPFTEV